jgi:hypothetical protein
MAAVRATLRRLMTIAHVVHEGETVRSMLTGAGRLELQTLELGEMRFSPGGRPTPAGARPTPASPTRGSAHDRAGRRACGNQAGRRQFRPA